MTPQNHPLDSLKTQKIKPSVTLRRDFCPSYEIAIIPKGEHPLHRVDDNRASTSPTFVRLGLTDAAIVSLDPEEIAILTVDRDLHIVARSGSKC